MSQGKTPRRFPNADFLDFISLFMLISVADGRGRSQRRKSLAFSMIRRMRRRARRRACLRRHE
jgi:hypothetical protein